MSTICPIDLDVQRLRSQIATLYTRVASDPAGEFHFHRGPEYAAAFLGYDSTELGGLEIAASCGPESALRLRKQAAQLRF